MRKNSLVTSAECRKSYISKVFRFSLNYFSNYWSLLGHSVHCHPRVFFSLLYPLNVRYLFFHDALEYHMITMKLNWMLLVLIRKLYVEILPNVHFFMHYWKFTFYTEMHKTLSYVIFVKCFQSLWNWGFSIKIYSYVKFLKNNRSLFVHHSFL